MKKIQTAIKYIFLMVIILRVVSTILKKVKKNLNFCFAMMKNFLIMLLTLLEIKFICVRAIQNLCKRSGSKL